jgi:uncharacterized membrane protein
MSYDQSNSQVRLGDLRALAEAGHLSPSAFERAGLLAGLLPTTSSWEKFFDRLLVFLGAILFLSGVIFFFAYNWNDLTRFHKFGIIEISILLLMLLAWYKKLDTLVGKAAAFSAAALFGPLLAVFGQTYQTGADPYQLFFGWATLIFVWVAISRFSGLWLLWLLIMNVAISLYLQLRFSIWDFFGNTTAYQILFFFNLAFLGAWEIGKKKNIDWMQNRWLPRLIACLCLVYITNAMMQFIWGSSYQMEHDRLLKFVPLVYLIAVPGMAWVYHGVIRDLLILAGTLFSGIVIFTVFIAHLLERQFGGFLLLAGLVVLLSVSAATWLRHLSKVWEVES